MDKPLRRKQLSVLGLSCSGIDNVCRNCTLIEPYSRGAVSALKEACGKFIPREEREAVDFSPIKFRRVKKYSKKRKIIESII